MQMFLFHAQLKCIVQLNTLSSAHSEPDGEFGSLESRVTLETFLQGCAGKVTVVVGRAGSGKTLLMSCLGQQWAQGLVSAHIQSYTAYWDC